MATTIVRKRSKSKRFVFVQKPHGVIHPRVEAVGPQHFGIVCVDCAKAQSKWMLADFYGNVRVAPAHLPHNRADLDAALVTLRQAMQTHQMRDVIVAVERTGRYHQVVQRAFRDARFDTRTVHPFATQQFRLPANPGNKTDDNDLLALHRAAVNGFALIDTPLERPWQELQLLIRHRRDWVRKASTLCCQAREHLEAALPGYAACFHDLWDSGVAFHLIRQAGSAEAMRQAGLNGLSACLEREGVQFQTRTLHRVLAWAAAAAAPDAAAGRHVHIALALQDDRTRKAAELQALEREIAGYLARTPYVLLLGIPGINVVSAADYAGEMGPISRYANAHAITGRAGLYPSRYQSDQVDRADGKLVRCANRSLRAAILQAADNLICSNQYFAALARGWKTAGKDPRWTHVKVAFRFCRISFHMVAGQQAFHHPSAGDRHYILKKLMAFHLEHDTSPTQTLADMQAAIDQLPPQEYAAEAAPLVQELEAIQQGRRRGRLRTNRNGETMTRRPPQRLGEILPEVLARLGVGRVQSAMSGRSDPA